jgi:tetratricopeptide (TPR) repeat protein
MGRPAVALESWRRAAEAGPADAAAQANLGQALLEAGDSAGALVALQRAVQAAPGNAGAWLDLGNANSRAGRFADALGAYEKALAIDPRLADAWLDLAILHLDVESPGMPAEARLGKAVTCLDRFAAEGGQDPSLAALRAEAQVALERERKRLARDAKESAARAAEPAGDAPGGAAAPTPPGGSAAGGER